MPIEGNTVGRKQASKHLYHETERGEIEVRKKGGKGREEEEKKSSTPHHQPCDAEPIMKIQ